MNRTYDGEFMNAWGRNASFQLACIHWLVKALQNTAKVLGEKTKPIWNEIARGLPKASLSGEKDREQIGLWNGTMQIKAGMAVTGAILDMLVHTPNQTRELNMPSS